MADPTPAKSPKPTEDDMPHMFEKVEEIKQKYAENIAAVRAQLTLPCPDDVIVYRFLRGHKFNESVAAEHLQSTLAWRQELKLDDLRVKAEKVDQRQYPFAEKVLAVHPHNIQHGFDKSGQPLSIERLGYANPYLMVRTVKFEEMQAYHLYHMEAKAAIVANLTAQTGTVIRTAKIMDLAGLGRQHLDRRGLVFFKKLIDLSQGHYPEMLGKLYVVNTPWIFALGWKIVKPWLNPMTLAKIHILEGNNFLEKLKEDIDVQHIPQFLGGECTCAGREGGCVPLVDPDASMLQQSISARGKFEKVLTIDGDMLSQLRASLPAPQTFRGVTVSYEFRTRKNDLAFSIRSASGGQERVLKEAKRYQADQDTIAGSFLVAEPTVLTFLFDNSFSMFTAKQLLYRVDTEACAQAEDQDEAQVAEAMQEIAVRDAPIFSPQPEEE